MNEVAQRLTAAAAAADAAVLAKGERVDRFIPKVLLSSPISRLGYWAATAFGLTWGTLLSTGKITKRDGLWVFRGMPNWSFGRGGVCVGGCLLTDDIPVTPELLRHEAVHKEQWKKYGMLLPFLYLFAGRDPHKNRFEVEAGLEAGGYRNATLRTINRTSTHTTKAV